MWTRAVQYPNGRSAEPITWIMIIALAFVGLLLVGVQWLPITVTGCLFLFGIGGGYFQPSNISTILQSGSTSNRGTIGSLQRMIQHSKANKTVTKATKRAPKLTIKPASSTKTTEKAIQKTTKKVTRKTMQKAAKRTNQQAAKNVTKKVTKKVAPKVTSKATKKAAPKATKKVTKLAAKKHSPLKPTTAHPTHKTSIKASAKL